MYILLVHVYIHVHTKYIQVCPCISILHVVLGRPTQENQLVVQDSSSCPALAANQTGRVDWWELAGWVGISWQSWPEGRAWQWLDPCRAESYSAGSCCWWCLEYLWVCGMGVRPVQGRHACQMLSIWYAKTPLSWNESQGTAHTLYKHLRTLYIHGIYNVHRFIYLIISLYPALLCAGHHPCYPSLSLLHWGGFPRCSVGRLLAVLVCSFSLHGLMGNEVWLWSCTDVSVLCTYIYLHSWTCMYHVHTNIVHVHTTHLEPCATMIS